MQEQPQLPVVIEHSGHLSSGETTRCICCAAVSADRAYNCGYDLHLRRFRLENNGRARRHRDILRGGRISLRCCAGIAGVRRIGVIGWVRRVEPRRAPARLSCRTEITVAVVYERLGIDGRRPAERFQPRRRPPGRLAHRRAESDLVILLIADAALATHYEDCSRAQNPARRSAFPWLSPRH